MNASLNEIRGTNIVRFLLTPKDGTYLAALDKVGEKEKSI